MISFNHVYESSITHMYIELFEIPKCNLIDIDR